MNDRESDSEEELQSESNFEIDLGAPSPDASKLLGKQREQQRSRGLLLLGKAAAAVAATKKEAAAAGALFPPRHPTPSPYSSPVQRTANINDLVSGKKGGKGGVEKSSAGGKGAAAAAKKKGLSQRKKGPSSSSSSASSSWSLAVPLLAALAALAAFAASWLVLQRVPEPQRTLRFRVPW